MLKKLIKSDKFWLSVFSQGLICSIILALYCAVGRFGPNSQTWDDGVKAYVTVGLIIFSVILVITLALTFLFGHSVLKNRAAADKKTIKEYLLEPKRVKGGLMTTAILVILITVSGLLRVQLLGSYQISDGIEYYNQIRTMAQFPQWFRTPHFFTGIVSGHIGYGFIFLSTFGQLLTPYGEMGFQYSYLVLGVIATCCFYAMFRKMVKDSSKPVCALAALIVSVQPLFFGLSTLCQMEFPLACAFIIVACCYMYKQYILMLFGLVVLTTCKETGFMMGLYCMGMFVLIEIIRIVVRRGGIVKTIKSLNIFQKILALAFIACAGVMVIKVLNMNLWGVRVLDLIMGRVSGSMQVGIHPEYIIPKLKQLFLLNFSWITSTLIVVGLIINYAVPSFRKKKLIDPYNLAFLVCGYLVYNAMLLFLPQSVVPRYNTLSDVLFLFFGMLVLIKLIDKIWVLIAPGVIIGTLMLVECFITIDPVSRAIFTNIPTNGIPMVWCFDSKSEKPIMNKNIGDLGYYNYQYSFVDRAVDKMLDEVDFQAWYYVVSSFRLDTEDTFKFEDLAWDKETRTRKYYHLDDRFMNIRRVYFEETPQIDDENEIVRAVWVEIPTCEYYTDAAYEYLSKYYDISEPKTVSMGLAGSITYRMIYKK